MVVDDSRIMELQICKLLEDSDFEVVAYCENGEEAIAKYEEILPDVVTLDLIMPGIDGLETAQVILDKHPDAKLIIISSLSDGRNNLMRSKAPALALTYLNHLLATA